MMEHVEEPCPEQVLLVKQMITRVGDFSQMTEEDDLILNLKSLADILVTVGDIKEFAAEISDLFLKCLTQLSVQVSILATLLALIYKQDPEFPTLVVERLSQRIITALGEGDIWVCKIALRTVACLSSCNCISVEQSGGLADVLDTFLNIAYSSWRSIPNASDGTGKLEPALSEAGQIATYLVASTIPWAISALSASPAGSASLSRAAAQFARCLAEWEGPHHPEGSCPIFLINAVPVDTEEDEARRVPLSVGPAGVVCWDSLWESCRFALDVIAEAGTGRGFTAPVCIKQPWRELQEELSPQTTDEDTPSPRLQLGAEFTSAVLQLWQSGRLASARPADPASASLGLAPTNAPWLRTSFVVFDSGCSPQAAELCSSLTYADKVVALGYYQDVLHFFEPVVREDGTTMGSVELLVKHLLAVQRMFPDHQHMEYLLVEFLLQAILSSDSPTRSAKLYRVVLELCKQQLTVPPVLALGASVLFQLLPELDGGAWRKLAKWLSFHLVNTQLRWPYWDIWAEELQSGDSAVSSFLTSLLHDIGRAVIPEYFSAAVPQSLQPLWQVALPFVPRCDAYDNPSVLADARGEELQTPQLLRARKLYRLVERKEDAEVVEAWLEAQLDLDGQDDLWRLRLLVQALFHLGKDTPSSLLALLDRYCEPLRLLADGPIAQLALLQLVYDMAAHDPGTLNSLLDALLRRALVSVTTLAEYLSATLAAALEEPWLFARVEVLLDRALDFVRGSVAYRRQQLGDRPLWLAGYLLAPDGAAVSAVEPAVEGDVVIGTQQDEDDGMDCRRDQYAEKQEEDSPDSVTAAAVEAAVDGCRAVYASLARGLLRLLLKQESGEDATEDGAEAEVELGGREVAALSLLLRLLRAVHGAEAWFASGPEPLLLRLGDPAAVLQTLQPLATTGRLADFNQSILHRWRRFTSLA